MDELDKLKITVADLQQELERYKDAQNSLTATTNKNTQQINAQNSAMGKTGQALKDLYGGGKSGLDQFQQGLATSSRYLQDAFKDSPNTQASIQLMGEAMQESVTQADRVNRVYNDLSKTGAVLGEGLDELSHRGTAFALAIGASEADARKYTKVIGDNSQTLARMSGTVRDGRRTFEESFVAMGQYRLQLQQLGYTTEEQMEGMADYMRLQTIMGRSQRMSQQQLADGAARYLKELNGLAAVTGASVENLKKADEAALAETRFLATMMEMEEAGMHTQMEQVKNLNRVLSTIGPEGEAVSKGFREMVAGTMTTVEAQRLDRITGGEASRIAAQVRDGQLDAAEASTKLAASIEQGIQQNRKLARNSAEAFEETFGPLSGLNKAVQTLRGTSEKTAQVEKAQNEIVSSEADTRMQLNAAMNQSVVNTVAFQDAMSAIQPEAVGLTAAMTNLRASITPELTGVLVQFKDNLGAVVRGEKGAMDALQDAGRTLKDRFMNMMPESLGGTAPRAGAGGAAAPGAAARPPAGGAAAGRPGAAAPAGMTQQDLAAMGLTIKQGDVQAPGSQIDPRTIELARKIQAAVPNFAYFSGFNDRFHQEQSPGSQHVKGLAMDFTLQRPPTKEEGQKIAAMIKQMGAQNVIDEYNSPSRKSTGGHFHVSLPEARFGGIFDGPQSGFGAILHGMEAVVPLPNNRKIPVEMPDMPKMISTLGDTFRQEQDQKQGQIMQNITTIMGDIRSAVQQPRGSDNGDLRQLLSEMLSVQRTQQDTMEKLLQNSRN